MRAPLVLLFPFFLLFLTSPAAVDAALDTYSTGYPDCPIVECGDFNISYPFWVYPNPVSGANPSTYCGYRGLNITCDGDNKPVFHTLTDNYTVKSVNKSSNTISLVDADVVGKTCPRAKHSVTIQNAPTLNFTRDVVTITFYFNCSSSTKDLNIPEDNVAGCLEGEAGLSYIFNSTNPPSPEVNATLLKECKGLPIESRVRREDIGKTILGKAFGDAMNKGFDLTWNLYDNNLATCKSCELAEGRCGFLNTETGNAFHCFCPTQSSKCQQYWQSQQQKVKGRLSVLAKVGIAFAGLGVGILLTGTAVFLWRQRKRRLEKGNSSVTASSFFKSVTPTSSSYGFGGGDLESSVGEYYHTPTFTYEELEVATGGFAEELGDGGFGTVYKGKLKDGRIVAIKCLHENTNRRVVQFRNEIEILNRLRHQNLVTLYGCSTRDSPKLLLVYEFVPNGTVADHLHGARSGERALHWPLRMSVAIESAAALSYLHAVKPQIIHRDVKTSNILLDSDFHVKVADFGLSRLFPNLLGITHVSTAPQGTPGYVDPEYHQCYQLTDKSDVYSFGVVLVELVTSMPAVDISRKRNEINLSNLAMVKIAAGAVGEMADGGLGYGSDMEVTRMMKAVCELAFRCLQQEREMRPTMLEVLEELKRIESGENSYDQTKKKKDSPDSRDDVYLLNVADSQTGSTSSPPFSPNTVDGNSWPSRSTTPFASV